MSGWRLKAIVALAVIAAAGAVIAGLERVYRPTTAATVAAQVAPSPSPRMTTRPPVPPPPCPATPTVCIQLSTGLAWLTPGGLRVAGPVPVSLGTPESPTPVGLFPVDGKTAETSSVLGEPMLHTVYFRGDLALFEGDIALPTNGSVRVPPEVGALFFDHVNEGELIEIVP